MFLLEPNELARRRSASRISPVASTLPSADSAPVLSRSRSRVSDDGRRGGCSQQLCRLSVRLKRLGSFTVESVENNTGCCHAGARLRDHGKRSGYSTGSGTKSNGLERKK